MNFKDCIDTAVSTGKLSAKKAGESHAAFDKEFARAKAAGETEGQAATTAALKAVEEITTLKAEKRWQRINEMQRAHTIHTRMAASKDPARELERIADEMELSYETTIAFAQSHLDLLMSKYKPKLGGLSQSVDNMDDAVYEAFGVSRNPEAKELADTVVASMELLRKMANAAGASIPESKNRHMFQSHDQVRVSAVPEETWVRDHLEEGTLDWDVMRFEGKKINPENREEILRRVYRGIVNDGAGRGGTAQHQEPGLATRLNRDRFLYYAGPEAWIKMQTKYGTGNFYEQTIGMIDAMAKDISILKTFGPSADALKEFAKREARERAAELNLAKKPGKRDVVKNIDRQIQVFEDMYRIHSRHVPSIDGNAAVGAFTTVRTIATNALLGGVFIPSFFGDLANMKMGRHFFNLPTARVFRGYAKNFVPTKQNIQQAVRGGVIYENATALATSRIRYFGMMDGPAWARRISDFTYRSGLAAHHTQVARNAEGKNFMGLLWDHKGLKFDDTPFMPMLVELGITDKQWDLFRVNAEKDVRGAKFLSPVDMYERAGSSGERAVAEKFGQLMQMYIRTAIPAPTLRSRRAAGEATDPNSAIGQLVRSTLSHMSFPISIHFNQLRRIADAPGIRNKMRLASLYFAWTFAAGIGITQAKALAQGQNLYSLDPFDEDQALGFNWNFYGRALINGGSFGILGDLLFNQIAVANSGYKPGTPVAEYFKSATKVLNDLAQGEPVAKDALSFMDKNIPDFWYTKLLVNRTIMDTVLEEADPAAYQRKIAFQQEHEEGSWWGMGEEAGSPDLNTLFMDR